MTGTAIDLSWGADYFARVRARDARGGESAWSDPHAFRLKQNQPPGTPGFDGGCVATTFDQTAPTSIVVRNVEDPEHEVVTFELEMFRFDDDPAVGVPGLHHQRRDERQRRPPPRSRSTCRGSTTAATATASAPSTAPTPPTPSSAS